MTVRSFFSGRYSRAENKAAMATCTGIPCRSTCSPLRGKTRLDLSSSSSQFLVAWISSFQNFSYIWYLLMHPAFSICLANLTPCLRCPHMLQVRMSPKYVITSGSGPILRMSDTSATAWAHCRQLSREAMAALQVLGPTRTPRSRASARSATAPSQYVAELHPSMAAVNASSTTFVANRSPWASRSPCKHSVKRRQANTHCEPCCAAMTASP
mmetsp:Transcript_122608/g.381685  ORF Transcript_122608/g.381685 Transcript_122608/m.381685 type:complete len:212 (+) Transcript_122608:143-778(+)